MMKKDTPDIIFITPFSFFKKAIKLNKAPSNKSMKPMRTIGSIISDVVQLITIASNPRIIKTLDHILKGPLKLVQPPFDTFLLTIRTLMK